MRWYPIRFSLLFVAVVWLGFRPIPAGFSAAEVVPTCAGTGMSHALAAGVEHPELGARNRL